ncbi:MAG: hypothetical protein ACI8QZ_002733 [Chlamydiales bacterium]|jgi:hypothetical protein
MSEPRDEFDALRQAWKQLQVPEELAHDASNDPETQACMDWMTSAWNSLEVPPPDRIAAPPILSVRRRVLRHVMPFAAAACLLFIWRAQLSGSAPADAPGRSLEIAMARPTRPVIRPVIHSDGSIETRSGSVRLILLPEQASEPMASPAEPSTTSPMEK